MSDITIQWKLEQIRKNGRNKAQFKKDLEAIISGYRLTATKFARTSAGQFAEKQANELQKKLLEAIKGITIK